FELINYNFTNKEHCSEIVNFLDKYYIEDNNHQFRLHFTEEYLEWLYSKTIHFCVGVKVKKNNLLIGFICGKLCDIQANKNKLNMIEINLLCIHPKLRNKRLTPLLINEINRLCQEK